MLPSVVLDPSIFWLAVGEDDVDLENIITATVSWLKRNPLGKFKILISGRMLERLAEADVFPAQPHFLKIIDHFGLGHVVSAKELATYVARFMSHAPTIEDACPVKDGLFEKIAMVENVFQDIPSENLREISKSACLLATVNSNVEDRNSDRYHRTRLATEKPKRAMV